MNELIELQEREIRCVLALIKAAYPVTYKDMDKSLREATVKLWLYHFKDTDIEILTAAVHSYISIRKFPPAISEIKEAVIRFKNPRITETAGMAWSSALQAASTHGRSQIALVKRDLTPQAMAAVKAVGWTTICSCNEYSCDTLRAHFLKAYNEIKTLTEDELRTGQALTIEQSPVKAIEDNS